MCKIPEKCLLTKNTFTALCTLIIILLSGCSDPTPNIILCMGDDHGWDETGYNGHPHVQTPVLDEMSASGLRLDHFYAAHPTCSPTRGSIMTGRHPNRYGTFTPSRSIRPEETGLAQILGGAGYLCGHFGKWHLGPVKAGSPTSPGAMGFDEWLSHDNFFEMDPYLSRNGGPPEQIRGEGSEILVEETIRFIEGAQKKGKPFFAVVWFGSPHEPYSGLEKDLALYDDLPDRYQKQTIRLTSNRTGLQTRRPLDSVLQERYAEITAMDRAIGKLRDWLQDNDLRRNTLLWYCSDNGTPAGGSVTLPFRGQKATLYEGGIRVPAIIEWPARIPSPRTTDVNTVTTDIFPTLCALAGRSLPGRPLDGISLEPLILGRMKERPEPICFWQFINAHAPEDEPWIDPGLQEGTTPLVKQMGGLYTRNFENYHYPAIEEEDYEGQRVILDGRYKLVIGTGSDPEKELFDLREDPAEENNLIDTLPELARDLEQKLHNWQGSVLTSLTGADYR